MTITNCQPFKKSYSKIQNQRGQKQSYMNILFNIQIYYTIVETIAPDSTELEQFLHLFLQCHMCNDEFKEEKKNMLVYFRFCTLFALNAFTRLKLTIICNAQPATSPIL